MRAWQRWQIAAGIITGPAFRRIDRHGRILGAMSPKAVGEAITRAGQAAGLDTRFTGHSVRAGLATEARRARHDAKTIVEQGGWLAHSAVLHGYMQVVDRWTDNAVKGIGL